ncbi:hypothetical protein SAICODRAFT_62809 [Saitoella complicata NRRL Y-17804]|nr:uncharacterized protein SAICODRAFT_62809 [Saitoella complicata NRRL Y-17804]ODQ49725.1 hypothetical protein SAICODRAFT_62809 [Saitoella complicata NRRL Y-17804]
MEGESAPDNILRKRRILVPFFVSCAFLAWGAFFGLILQKLLQEYRYDGSTYRFAYIAYFPITFVMSLFFVLVVIKNVYEIFGPVGMAFRNSFAYSAIPPKRMTGVLPQITIQCPVYKESLADVIEPTITSVKVAMRRYEKQGGTVNLVVCDDRMQLVDERSQEFRKAYYRKNSIGWVARPGHGVDGYVRAGRFKKASNLNTMMGVSVKVEERLKQIDRSNPEGWTPIDEERAYRSILSNVIAEDGRVWAEGNIRLGELILLIDSDTRVPSDCLLDAASEFAESPHLAVLQHASGVMHVSWDFFERGMAYFTSHIYRSIRISCASGDLAPFVGHNAFIRWSAVQTAAEWTHPDDGQPRWWSESHVSEDFEMALKLQCAGHSIRLAAYTKGEFREGVSLTVADEITRWEKYAYGCSELMFNPIRTWLWRSPFTPLFRQFLSTRSIPLFAKFTLLSYVGTYYALGAVWVFTFANYFFTGWAANLIDHVYADSFSTLISILVVFYGLSPLAGSIVSYKLGDKSFFRAMVETVKWTPFFSLFFSGISFRISAALLSHLFEYNMQWGATTKEVTNSDLFTELPKIFRDFRYTYLFFGIQIPMMLYLAFGAPYQWVINGLNSCFPLAVCIVGHMLLPLLLNPSLFKV